MDAYQSHHRIVPDTFERHLDRIANLWLDVAASDGSTAITTSTNDHVDAINSAVQAARLRVGQLDCDNSVGIGGGERAHLGDIVATRPNDWQLTTDRGEPVRNWELWTVAADRAPHRRGPSTAQPGEHEGLRLTGRQRGGIDIGF